MPFTIARIGERPTAPRAVIDAPDLPRRPGPDPAGRGRPRRGGRRPRSCRESFTEVHPLPGRDLMPVVDGDAPPTTDRPVYLMTRDNMLEGDSRRVGPGPPARLHGPRRRRRCASRCPPTWAPTSRALVVRVPTATPTAGRTTCGSWSAPSTTRRPGPNPGCATWPPTAPAATRTGPSPSPTSGSCTTSTPIRSRRSTGGTTRRPAPCSPTCAASWPGARARGSRPATPPWPYAHRHPTGGPESKKPPLPARWLRRAVQQVGMHPEDPDTSTFDLPGRRALVVVHQPRHARHRQAHRGVRVGDDGALLRVRRRRHGRRRRQPAGRHHPGRPAVPQAGAPLRRRTTASWPTTCCGPRSPTRSPSASWTWPTTTSCTWPAGGARRSTSARRTTLADQGHGGQRLRPGHRRRLPRPARASATRRLPTAVRWWRAAG